ncbi:MAG: hypothetical protein ACREN8_07550 [Candidatus Dormibacteraceae bacterium]
MKRRNIMLGSAAAAALTNSYSVNPDHWERLSKVVRNSNGIGETAVAALESETAALKNLHTGISSAQLFPHIDTHLGHLADILNRPMPPSMRQRLITTTGRIASLGGWVAWDNGYPQAAHRLYRISIKASHEAGDPSVLAACLLNMSYMPSSGGNNLEAERMLGQGMEQMTPSSSPLIATWLEASRAEVVARRDDQAALPLLEKSFHRFSTITPNVGTSESTPITPARMDSFALNVNLHLGRHSDAEPIARRLLGATSPSSPLHPISLSDVATVYLKTGNFEEGTEIASKALSAAVNAQSRWAMSRLNNLYALLSERAAKDQRAAEITNQFKEYSNNSY